MATTERHPPERGRPRLTPEEREALIRQTINAQLQKLDRILIGHTKLDVIGTYDDGMPAGYTTGDDIYMNYAWCDTKTDEDLVVLWGLNYHELSHVIMTPRLRGHFVKQISPVPSLGIPFTFNVMEDWRIETQFSAMFDSAKSYFTILCKKLLLDDHRLRKRKPEDEWTCHLLTMGRYYLDPALRMRYELRCREALKDTCRLVEIEAAIKAGQLDPSYLTDLQSHYFDMEALYGMPGLASQMLDLLRVKGDARVDLMNDLAREYCSGRFYRSNVQESRRMIMLIKKMHLLLPTELASESPSAGLPLPGNAKDGGRFGTDLPTHRDLDPDDLLQDDARDMAAEVIAEDEEQMEKLRKLAKGTSIKVGPDEDEESEAEGSEEDESDPDEGELPSEEELEGEEDEDDEDGSSESEQPEAPPPPSNEDEGLEASSGDSPDQPKPPVDPEPKIVIDPSQHRHEDDDDDEDLDEDDHDGEADGDRADGHLTGGAGGSADMDRDERLAQLSREQLKDLDRIFRDAGVIDKMLSDEVREMLGNQGIQRDLRNVRAAVAEALGENLDLDSSLNSSYHPVDPDIIRQRDRLERMLVEIRSLLEGTWRDDEPTGKVNLRRLLSAPRSQRGHIYRSWIKDEIDEAGMEVVVLLDRSSSMASAIDHASQICWMVASACQNAEGRVHVISFADEDKKEVLLTPAKTLRSGQYQPFGTYGGTFVAPALEDALRVFKGSNMPNRVLFIVTDGGFSDMQKSVPLIQKINQMDVDTVLMLLGLHMERGKRGCKHVVAVNDLDRAAIELKTMVQRMTEDVTRRVAQVRGFVND